MLQVYAVIWTLLTILVATPLSGDSKMNLFADDNKQRVKGATEIVDLLSSYLPQMRRQGANFVTHCPWHDDRRPSFQINPVRQTWACWVCDLRGDVFDFVMKREGVDFGGALQILADRAGIELRRTGPRIEKGSPEDKQTLYQAMAWAQQQFHRCLLEDAIAAAARRYLIERNLTAESIEKFRLGFAPLADRWLESRARNTPWSPPILEACGLVVANERGFGFYERFRGRLMFPILDTMSRTIGFGGRVVPGVFPEGEEPPAKYINSPETRLFSKSENLYGLHLATASSTKSRELVIVEGYTDVIASVQAGMQGVVACLGTAINQKHIRLMKRYADRITLVLDGDVAGQKRTSEVLDLFVAEDVDLRILTLPEGQDPFDYVQTAGPDAFRQQIASAPDALEHRIRQETAGVDLRGDSHRALQALDRILQTIAQSPASVTGTESSRRMRIDQLLTRLERQFDIDRNRMKERLGDLRRRRITGMDETDPGAPATTPVVWSKLDALEVNLLELLLSDYDLLDTALEQVDPQWIGSDPLRKLFQMICEGWSEGSDVSFEGLILRLENPVQRDLLIRLDESATAKQAEATQPTRVQLEALLRQLRLRQDESRRRILLGRMETQSLAEESELDALQQMLKETRERLGIANSMDGVSPGPLSPTMSTDFDPEAFPPDSGG